jgi:hypothetical protein
MMFDYLCKLRVCGLLDILSMTRLMNCVEPYQYHDLDARPRRPNCTSYNRTDLPDEVSKPRVRSCKERGREGDMKFRVVQANDYVAVRSSPFWQFIRARGRVEQKSGRKALSQALEQNLSEEKSSGLVLAAAMNGGGGGIVVRSVLSWSPTP